MLEFRHVATLFKEEPLSNPSGAFMTRGSRYLTLMLALLLLGCEPKPGKVIRTAEKRVGTTAVKVEIREEASRGNPAQGQHVEFKCQSAATIARGAGDRHDGWVLLTNYWTAFPYKDPEAPLEFVDIVNENIIYTKILPRFSIDACITINDFAADFTRLVPKTLQADIPAGEEVRSNYPVKDSPVGMREPPLHYIPRWLGDHFEIELGPRYFIDGKGATFASFDAGKTWTIKARN